MGMFAMKATIHNLVLLLWLWWATPAYGQSDHLFSDYRHYQDYTCSYYLAPSELGGYGVFAGRDFEENEIVEIVPRFLPMLEKWLSQNDMDNYDYGYEFSRKADDKSFGLAAFGMTGFYNHGDGHKQNVLYTSFGMEPDAHCPLCTEAIGFVTLRSIRRGEELLSSYCEPEYCGRFFRERELSLRLPNEYAPEADIFLERESQYCSKVYAGIGHSTWVHRVMETAEQYTQNLPKFDFRQHLPLQDHPTAIVIKDVEEGQMLEIAPALLLPLDQVADTAMAPAGITWNDWDEDDRKRIKLLHEEGLYHMKARNAETDKMEADVLEYYDDAVIMPLAGNLGLVRKVGDSEESNCRFEVVSALQEGGKHKDDLHNAGIALKLMATKDMKAGEELKVNLPDSSSWKAKMHLMQLLAMVGYPFPKHLADAYNQEVVDLDGGSADEL